MIFVKSTHFSWHKIIKISSDTTNHTFSLLLFLCGDKNYHEIWFKKTDKIYCLVEKSIG